MFSSNIVENLKDDEEIIEIVRKHWGSFLKQIIVSFFILALPFFFVVLLFSRWWTMLIFFVWISIGIGYGLYQWSVWYLDSLVITNIRIINIDQKTLFSKEVSEALIQDIQNVTYEIKGILPSIMGYGRVNISTAGSTWGIDDIEEPEEIHNLILTLKEKQQ